MLGELFIPALFLFVSLGSVILANFSFHASIPVFKFIWYSRFYNPFESTFVWIEKSFTMFFVLVTMGKLYLDLVMLYYVENLAWVLLVHC